MMKKREDAEVKAWTGSCAPLLCCGGAVASSPSAPCGGTQGGLMEPADVHTVCLTVNDVVEDVTSTLCDVTYLQNIH